MAGILSLPEGCIADVIFFISPSQPPSNLPPIPMSFGTAFCLQTTLFSSAVIVEEEALPPRLSQPCPHKRGQIELLVGQANREEMYMISARELSIIWVDNPLYWTWISLPEASGTINTSLMSPVTTYVAYLVFKRTQYFFGFDSSWDHRVEVTVGHTGSDGQKRTVYFHSDQGDIVYGDDHGRFPQTRGDGWLESELGEFFYGGDEEGELS
ncbi:hypothetical protein LWI29_003282 [Acer saccharum]|uniref:Uncharacterized protein n=1 Tax=Acer saccharum TaxID=4024 RepID=A0AA39SM05_ACESA|nr:hypothetical protein LWI29_003282 [Acer saccharum]